MQYKECPLKLNGMKLNNAIEVSEINSEYITLINKATGLPVIINKEALAKALRSYRKVYIRDLEKNADDLLIDGVYTYYNITNVPYTSGILRVSSNMYTISSGKEYEFIMQETWCRDTGKSGYKYRFYAAYTGVWSDWL